MLRMAACFVFFAASAVIAQSAPPASLLPGSFSGWERSGTPIAGTQAAAADSANADVLNEYGLKDFEQSTYRHGGSRLTVRALRFADATGAYGAFTYYRKPGMRSELVGNAAAANPQEVLFWSGSTLVDATSDATLPNVPALKSLVATLPPVGGNVAAAPTLPDYLPTASLDRSTIRYAIGPVAYGRSGGVLPPSAIDFSRDAEAVTAQYKAKGGQGTLTLIEYPTPQMAIQSEKNLNALIRGPLPTALQSGGASSLAVHRSGPLVAVTSGSFTSEEAQALLAQVKYQADVTWNRGNMGGNGEVKKAASLLIGITYLTSILALLALVLGIFLGGGRAAWRLMHGKPASTVYEEDFISLGLADWARDSTQKLP